MLKRGSKGQEVRALQEQLLGLGFELDVDGDFGPATDTAVRKLQTLFNYTVDGIAGPGTLSLAAAQTEHGWNVNSPDAVAQAQAANPTSVA